MTLTATYMPFLSIDWTVVFMLLNTLILFLIMKKLLFKPVKAMIDARQEELKKLHDDAQKAKADAEQMKTDYVKSLSGAKEEANEIVKSATQKAQTKSDEIVREAQEKATKLLEKADLEIEREKKKAINEIKDEISDIAIMIATKVVDKDINAKDHERLIEQFIDGVGDVSWKN